MEITYIKEAKINIDNKVYSKMLDILLDPNCFDYEDLVPDGKLDAEEVVQCFYENIDILIIFLMKYSIQQQQVSHSRRIGMFFSYTKMRDEFREFLMNRI